MAVKKLPKKVIAEVAKFKNTLQADQLPIKAVYVFGSYAKGKQRRDSDIDVCVISSDFKDYSKVWRYLWSRRPQNWDLTIEPIGFSPKDFNDQSSPLVHEIKKYGVKV